MLLLNFEFCSLHFYFDIVKQLEYSVSDLFAGMIFKKNFLSEEFQLLNKFKSLAL